MGQASPTLDLASECFRFVVAFFEVISMSTSHIYISALPLSPKTSLIREAYKEYASPSVRVVWGLPVSWEQSLAISHEDFYSAIAWSPCSRFLAVAEGPTARVLDATTLKPLSTFRYLQDSTTCWLSFSPDSRVLMQFCRDGNIASWDLQTGSPVDIIPLGMSLHYEYVHSSAYSTDGKIIALSFMGSSFVTITCRPTPHTSSYRTPDGTHIGPIWTHGQCFRYASFKSESIAIWEVGFTSIHTPVEVEHLPVPVEIIGHGSVEFLPSLSRFAFTREDTVFVWAARDSRFLLNSGPLITSNPKHLSKHRYFSGGPTFSPDGHFFACATSVGEVHLWKEFPAGYTPHQKFAFPVSTWPSSPLLSPSGESLVASTESITHLWQTQDQVAPGVLNLQVDQGEGLLLGFSTDEAVAAFACSGGNTVEVLDLRSGDLRLFVNTGIEIECLGVDGSCVVVVNREKIVTWNIPAENSILGTRASVDDSIRTTSFDPPIGRSGKPLHISISPDLSRIAVALRSTSDPKPGTTMIYDASTGRHLADNGGIPALEIAWFALDEHEIWGAPTSGWLGKGYPPVSGWRITEGSESGRTELEDLETSAFLPGVSSFWESSRGYKVTPDGWVLGPSQKRLLWLPHKWRSLSEHGRTWRGQFLGLQGSEQLEVVILEFFG